MADGCGGAGSGVLRKSEKNMVRRSVLAVRIAAILDWVFLAIVVLILGLGVSCATPQIKIDPLEPPGNTSRSE